MEETIELNARKRLATRARIFRRYLKIRFDRPYTIFLACLFPFMQAFLAGGISGIIANKGNVFLLGMVGLLYYASFVANAKRSAKGSNLGIALLIVFGAIGLMVSYLVFA